MKKQWTFMHSGHCNRFCSPFEVFKIAIEHDLYYEIPYDIRVMRQDDMYVIIRKRYQHVSLYTTQIAVPYLYYYTGN